MNTNNSPIEVKKSMLIVFEGISGSGKSENVKRLSTYFHEMGMKNSVIEWNSNRTIRRIINVLQVRGFLKAPIYSFLQWTSFLTDYYIKILPLLLRGYVVIADRYIYTAITRDAANASGRFLGRIIHCIVRKPDIVIYQATPLDLCYKRIKGRGKRLFHTNKLIQNNKLLKDGDLYYLKKLSKEYTKLFRDSRFFKNTDVIYLNEKWANVCSIFTNTDFQKAKEKHMYEKEMEYINNK